MYIHVKRLRQRRREQSSSCATAAAAAAATAAAPTTRASCVITFISNSFTERERKGRERREATGRA